MNHFSIGLWHVIESGFYVTTGDNQLKWLVQEEAPNYFLKPNLHQKKKVTVTVWWSAAHLIHWIPVKPLRLRSMLSKSTRCTENCSASSLHWSTERAQFFSMTTPNCILPNQCFKSWTNWATTFCLICHIHLTSRQMTTTSSSILTTFCRENTSTTCRMQKMFSRVCQIPKHRFLCYRNKLTYFSLAKMC